MNRYCVSYYNGLDCELKSEISEGVNHAEAIKNCIDLFDHMPDKDWMFNGGEELEDVIGEFATKTDDMINSVLIPDDDDEFGEGHPGTDPESCADMGCEGEPEDMEIKDGIWVCGLCGKTQ